ncbi:MAG: cytochrome b5-like heme/steroid binding domain-containing protein, partial [Patescibacteria group bacterium]
MNKQKIIALVLGAVVVLIAVVVAINQPKGKGKQPPRQLGGQPQNFQTTSTSGSKQILPAYTLANVSGHVDAESCWTIVNGSIYDLTAWVSQHPGGEEKILSICGKDGSAAFNGQ